MANTTHIVTTVMKLATNPRDADATPRVNIQDFCEEYYKDILPIIMDKVRRDKQKEIHARLDFGEAFRERRTREGSHYSSARTLSGRYHNQPERLKIRDRLRYNDRHVLDRLGHQRQSAFDRLSETYSPSTTKSRSDSTSSRDRSRGRSRPHRRDSSNGDRPESRDYFCGVGELYDNSHSSYGTGIDHVYRYRARDRSRHMKRGMDSESSLSRVSESGSSDGGYWKSKSKRHKPTDEDDLTMPWMCKEVDPFIPRIRNFKSLRKTRMPINVKTYDGTGDPEDHVKNFQAAAQVERWAMPTWCHMFNSTLIGAARESTTSSKRTKRPSKTLWNSSIWKPSTCMRISRFMHGVNNPELTKCLNKHVPKTMEEMMITTIAFVRGEVAVASKKKGHTSWRTHDQSKRHTLKKRYDFRGKLLHLIKEIKQGRDQSKVGKKEAPAKDKPMAIYMIQSWQRTIRQKVTQSFKRVREITFSSLETSSGTEGPLVIEAEIGAHIIHRMSLSPYNGIIERHGIKEIQAVPSTAHRMLKFPADGRIVTIHSSILIPAEWATVITSSKEIPKEAGVHHENFKVALHPNVPDQEVAIEWTLSAKGRTELCSLLKENLDIFTWQLSDMTGVPRSVDKHRLNIREGYSPVRQKKRGQAPKRAKVIQAEDCYPLSEIDWKVESLGGYPFKCFLDAYKGYHHIQLAESDEDKTAFHTVQGVYCHTKMPFGLKNAGAAYQRLVEKAFDSQIGRNIKVYVDDLVIKSHTKAEMLRDIDETFRTLRKIKMKLNLKKCTFGAVKGMFLGYMITPEGKKPCPDKTKYALQLLSPRIIKEVQSLDGKMASLNRFLSKSAEKSLPLFKTLKKCIKKSDFHWTSEAKQAFKQLKQHLSELPLLIAPKPKEELIVYLSASYAAISAVLMTERRTVHTPVYFVSRVLQGPELNYTPMES
nr:reverse transcriptase domain-containing protein [Tanacetum cinerariifolium]